MKKAVGGKNNKKSMTPEVIKQQFQKLSRKKLYYAENKEKMDDTDLYNFFLEVLKF